MCKIELPSLPPMMIQIIFFLLLLLFHCTKLAQHFQGQTSSSRVLLTVGQAFQVYKCMSELRDLPKLKFCKVLHVILRSQMLHVEQLWTSRPLGLEVDCLADLLYVYYYMRKTYQVCGLSTQLQAACGWKPHIYYLEMNYLWRSLTIFLWGFCLL